MVRLLSAEQLCCKTPVCAHPAAPRLSVSREQTTCCFIPEVSSLRGEKQIKMSGNVISLLVLSICLISTWMISSEAIQAELYRQCHRVVSGIFKAKLVASRMQCLHLCERADGCQGMNIERGKKNYALKCELTSQIVHDVVSNDGSLKEDDNWEFYKVAQLV